MQILEKVHTSFVLIVDYIWCPSDPIPMLTHITIHHPLCTCNLEKRRADFHQNCKQSLNMLGLHPCLLLTESMQTLREDHTYFGMVIDGILFSCDSLPMLTHITMRHLLCTCNLEKRKAGFYQNCKQSLNVFGVHCCSHNLCRHCRKVIPPLWW